MSTAESILRKLVADGEPSLVEPLQEDFHVVFDSGWIVLSAEELNYLRDLSTRLSPCPICLRDHDPDDTMAGCAPVPDGEYLAAVDAGKVPESWASLALRPHPFRQMVGMTSPPQLLLSCGICGCPRNDAVHVEQKETVT